jgi:hypothetical protein
MMENELAGKQHEIEELNRELEEMRATCGTEGLQQVRLLLWLLVPYSKNKNRKFE